MTWFRFKRFPQFHSVHPGWPGRSNDNNHKKGLHAPSSLLAFPLSSIHSSFNSFLRPALYLKVTWPLSWHLQPRKISEVGIRGFAHKVIPPSFRKDFIQEIITKLSSRKRSKRGTRLSRKREQNVQQLRDERELRTSVQLCVSKCLTFSFA